MSDPQEKREFDRYAENYANLLRDPVRDRFADSSRFFAERKLQIVCGFFERLGKDMHGLDWLDAGCGQGEMLRLGQPYFRSAAGCDPSTGMLGFASGLDVRQQPSIDVLPFEDGRFDFITLVCVYHHVELRRRAALTNDAKRVLRPGGILCIVEHNPWNPVTRLIVSRTPIDAGAQLLSLRQTRHLLSGAGFSILAAPFFLFLPERVHKRFPSIENTFRAVPIGGQYAVFGQKK